MTVESQCLRNVVPGRRKIEACTLHTRDCSPHFLEIVCYLQSRRDFMRFYWQINFYCRLFKVTAEKGAPATRQCHSAACTLHCRGSPHSVLFQPAASINRYRNSRSARHFFFLPFLVVSSKQKPKYVLSPASC